MELSFRQFVELSEKEPSLIQGLADELPINPDAFKNNLQWLAFPQLGNNVYNGSPYKILGFVYDSSGEPTHAKVQLINGPGLNRRQYRSDNNLRISDKVSSENPDNKIYVIPIKGKGSKPGLQDMMTQGWEQPGGAGGGEMGL